MIRVLHIINGADLGGISTLLLNYYRHIDRNEFHFDFACTAQNPVGHNGKELQALGANFYQLPLKSRHPLRHGAELRKLLRRGNYDAVHVHGSLTSFYDLAEAKRVGTKIRIAHSHSAAMMGRDAHRSLKEQLFERLNLLYATKLVACSRDAARYAYGEPALEDSRTLILPNSIDCDRFRFDEAARKQLRGELGIPSDAFVYGSVGRLSAEKNPLLLIRLLPKIRELRSNARLLLVGDGAMRQEAEALVRELKIEDHVIFAGQRSDVERLLNVMDVFVVPSFHEGFCIAALEAGTNGLPLILSDSVPKDLLFFSNAVSLSLRATEESWVEAICAERTRDPNGADEAAAHGFDLASSVKTLEGLYLPGRELV